MILRPFRRGAENRTIAALYGMIVTQARSPAFYTDYGVPDTVEGRFDLIVLHLVLLLRRLAREDGPAHSLGQRLFDTFCRDLDGNLREMGIGDLAVPKHMRRFGEAFYGRQAAYVAAFDAAHDRDFEKAIARNIFQTDGIDDRAVRLARYARAALGELDAQEQGALIRGEVAFPNPEAFADARA
ncbi:MAG: ubiquinol-cytochrome C chaperone family protein [Xanthobacteraceae bacterium]